MLPPTQAEPELAEVLEQARSHWGLEGECRFLRHGANFAYLALRAGAPVVLRLTDHAHRPPADTEAELQWLVVLRREGVRATVPLVSHDGRWLEIVRQGSRFFSAVLFEHVEGESLSSASLTESFAAEWGRYLSRLHRLAQRHGTAIRRADFFDDINFLTAERGVEISTQLLLAERFRGSAKWLRERLRTPHTYGLGHGDLHPGNFFMSASGMVAFDFDDACPMPLAVDLAAPLVSIRRLSAGTPHVRVCEEAFLRGYRSEHRVAPELFVELERVIDFRLLYVYFWIVGRRAANTEAATDEFLRRAEEFCLNEFISLGLARARPLL